MPLLGSVVGIGLALLGSVCSLVGTGGGSHGSWATLSPESFFCHSCMSRESVSHCPWRQRTEDGETRVVQKRLARVGWLRLGRRRGVFKSMTQRGRLQRLPLPPLRLPGPLSLASPTAHDDCLSRSACSTPFHLKGIL